MMSLAPFKKLVYQRCGLQLDGIAEARLYRAIASLQATTGLSTTSQLLDRLTRSSALFDDFVSQLTVNETYFCREPDALHWLVNAYLPERLATGAAPLSIFSAGCSSGEEPYSLAMMLYEHFGERAKRLFKLSGGDLDQNILDKARQGIYGGMSFRSLSPLFKARYFSPHEGRFKLHESLREWVTFRPFNLLNADESSPGGPFDVILFRNVSIYFDEQTRRHIHQHLRQLLAPDGILICGVTETLGNDLGVLELAEAQGIFYFRRTEPPSSLITPSRHPAWINSDTQAGERNEDRNEGQIENQRENNHEVTSSADLTLVAPLVEEREEARGDITHQLNSAHQLLNQNAFAKADSLLQTLLTQHPWSIDALVLAGLVARWQQQPILAHDYFKRAIYTAPDCWPAHFYLAELYRQGELDDQPLQRQRRYAAVVRLLTNEPTSKGGLDTIAPPLPPGDARFLAERHLGAVNITLASSNNTQGVG